MCRIEMIAMSMREIDRLKTVQAVVNGDLKPMVAVARLGISDARLALSVEYFNVLI